MSAKIPPLNSGSFSDILKAQFSLPSAKVNLSSGISCGKIQLLPDTLVAWGRQMSLMLLSQMQTVQPGKEFISSKEIEAVLLQNIPTTIDPNNHVPLIWVKLVKLALTFLNSQSDPIAKLPQNIIEHSLCLLCLKAIGEGSGLENSALKPDQNPPSSPIDKKNIKEVRKPSKETESNEVVLEKEKHKTSSFEKLFQESVHKALKELMEQGPQIKEKAHIKEGVFSNAAMIPCGTILPYSAPRELSSEDYSSEENNQEEEKRDDSSEEQENEPKE